MERGTEEGGEPKLAAAPPVRSMAKNTVSPEVLYERYRGERGMELPRFLKFFRDAVLYDNSWTWGQAVTVFFDHAVDDDAGQPSSGDQRRLSFHMFRSCLRRFIRQSTLIIASAKGMQPDGYSTAADDEHYRWEAFKMIVGQRLHGAPRSDEDVLLKKFFLQEPIQLECLQNEYHLRRVYKVLVKSKEPSVKSWEDLCRAESPMNLKKEGMVKCLRELIPKESVPLRGEDQSNALRHGNHENTSHEEGTKDTSSGSVSFAEFLEMLVRCALGTTPFSSSPRQGYEEEEDAKDSASAEEDLPDARSFIVESDTMEFALQRIRKIWGWLFKWLQDELDKFDQIKELDDSMLMEDAGAYDTVYSDVQMLFAHYASGQPYSRTLDFTDPALRVNVPELLKCCRDTALIDSRVTLTVINEEYKRITGKDLGSNVGLSYFQWQCIMVRLAKIKYKELRARKAIHILLKKFLVPMVYVEVAATELTDFVYEARVVGLCLSYEPHLERMLEQFSSNREVTISPDGDIRSHAHEEDEWKTTSSGLSTSFMDAFNQNKKAAVQQETGGDEGSATTRVVKASTLVDLVSLLKFIGFLPDILAIDEVPGIFSAVINASPVHQQPIYHATISVSQVLVVLVQCALVGFARAPYSVKYATREEKVLAALELVEIAYLALFKKYIPLNPPKTFPSEKLELAGITLERELRQFLLTRRLERGVALVPEAHCSRAEDAFEDLKLANAGKTVSRMFSTRPELDNGARPISLGVPCLIREQLFAPVAPHPVGPLMETALMHHNSARYNASVETYLQALYTWTSMLAEESVKVGGGEVGTGSRDRKEGEEEEHSKESKEAGGSGLSDELLLFFFVALGGVYESAGLEELALACFCEGKIVGDRLPEDAPESALGYAATGGIFYHLEQYQVALNFFEKAVTIREETLGELHMDTALLFNNIGCCYDMLDRVTEAVESFQKAKDVFSYEYGLTHPRTGTVMRNLSRIRQRRLDFAVKFQPRKPTPCPKVLAAAPKKKKGKKGGKKGGKKKK